jgi:hypothetical protein
MMIEGQEQIIGEISAERNELRERVEALNALVRRWERAIQVPSLPLAPVSIRRKRYRSLLEDGRELGLTGEDWIMQRIVNSLDHRDSSPSP